MATPARISTNTTLPTDGKAAGLENPLPDVDRSGDSTKGPLSAGPKQRANGSYAPASYLLDSGNIRTDN